MTRVWVADTCALLEVRRCVLPADSRQTQSARKRVFQKLEELARAGRIVFPQQTYDELHKGHSRLERTEPDHPHAFVVNCKAFAVRQANWDIVKELGEHTLVRRVADPHAEHDEADIYVLAAALDLQRAGTSVGVLTQERRDRDGKLSVTTACGLLGLVCMPMQAFLHAEGIWTWEYR
jgi:hypothetical protein